ncbi:anthocyanidin 5,3-O-glucosyltransferase-like [Hibiscus syriacus]|uniref:Glycosyltransferase n=1 Tax=Hibiscus syriacus TaxID=106335 RepID=A0A6A3C749_HIBSY|nr:UDP-glycosyltransferase 88F3-like [Hibiscus syriacus]KAE8723398.1 anthocyanidin 5,3-O-glucosyltransferase-like [Hibiscus syriacus]
MQETIVLYPSPGLGHVLSMVELGKLILSRSNNRYSISILLTTGFWDTPSIFSHIDSVSKAFPSISFLRFPSISVDLSQNCSAVAIWFQFIRLQAPNAHRSLQEISKTRKVSAFVIDLFCTSTLSVGKDLKIPTFYFFTSGASTLAAFLQIPQFDNQTSGKSFKDLPDTIFHFQGVPPLRAVHMPEPLLDRQDPAYHELMYFISSLQQSDGIIVNTFEDLEPISVKAIADGLCLPDAPTPPTFYVGPLIVAGKGEAESNYCLSWLEKQPSGSVVFLCFGSRGTFYPSQVKEIAKGLEMSGQRFLWVVNDPPNNEKKTKQAEDCPNVDLDYLLPEGFIERTKDRGLVVKSFVPQVAVLNKDSVGGFVTHCGWNSVLEAVVAGVPMIAWPLYAEQHLNRNILVEDMKMAIPVEQRDGDGFVIGTELEKRVRELMEMENGKVLRERSMKMKQKALASLGPTGCSIKALTKLVELWNQG